MACEEMTDSISAPSRPVARRRRDTKGPNLFHWRVFLGGAFVAAAAMGAVGPLFTAPTMSALAIPAVTAGRIGGIVEVVGSILGGIAAAKLTARPNKR